MNISRTSPPTSSTLLRQVQSRDDEAWNRFSERYCPLVFHWCRRYGIRQEDAADISQDVFVRVYEAIGSFRLDEPGSSFRGWLWTITRHQICDFYRRADRAQAAGGTGAQIEMAHVPAQMPADEDDAVQASIVSGICRETLEQIRGEFEDRTWTAFWRAAVEGDSTADIAADQGITAGAVRQAKRRVLKRLREEFGEA